MRSIVKLLDVPVDLLGEKIDVHSISEIIDHNIDELEGHQWSFTFVDHRLYAIRLGEG